MVDQATSEAKQAKPETPIQLSPFEKVAEEFILAKVISFNPFRRDRIVEWMINMSYVAGSQNIGINATGNVVQLAFSPHRVTANKIGPAVARDISLSTKNPPKFDITPTGTDSDDIATAIAAQKVEKYLRRINDFDMQRGDLMKWYDIANVAFRKVMWDPFFRVIGTNPEEEQEGHDPKIPAGHPIFEGEVISEVIPPNEVIWDWRIPTHKLPWIIHARSMTFGEIRKRWPGRANRISPSKLFIENSGANEFEVSISKQINNMGNRSNSNINIMPKSDKIHDDDKLVSVFELWHKRDINMATGLLAVLAGDQIMEAKPYPIEIYPHGELPLIGYDMLSLDQAYTGTRSRVSQARPLQLELNDLRTQIKENTVIMGNGLWMVPREAKLNFKRVDNGVALIVEYDGRAKPERQQGVALSSGFFAHLATIRDDINEIFAFHEVSKGKQPRGGPRSGVGLQILAENDLQQTAPIIRALERRDERAMHQMLTLAFANYNERTLSIVGTDNEWTLFEFNPQQLVGHFNVQVRHGSSFPTSKSIEREFAIGLLQVGLIDPSNPAKRRKILRVLDIGNMDILLKDDAREVNFAKKEYLIAEKIYSKEGPLRPDIDLNTKEGMDEAKQIIFIPDVNIFDDHEVHVIEHKEHLLTHYYELVESGDIGKILLAQMELAHYQQHGQILSQQQLQQALIQGNIDPDQFALLTGQPTSDEKEETETKNKED